MGNHYSDDLWRDLDSLEIPTYAGRRLDAGGFILGDPFDTILRHISVDYLKAAWVRLHPILRRYEIEPGDLSWGWLHSGEARISGLEQPAPSHFTGWTTLQLDRFRFFDDPRFIQLDDELKTGFPALRCGCIWRTKKWNIAPDDFSLATRLIEAIWTDDCTDWSPYAVLWDDKQIMDLWRKSWDAFSRQDYAEHGQIAAEAQSAYTAPEYHLRDERLLNEPWRQVAVAIEANNQQGLERALAESRAAYSPMGYRILERGFRRYLTICTGGESPVHMP